MTRSASGRRHEPGEAALRALADLEAELHASARRGDDRPEDRSERSRPVADTDLRERRARETAPEGPFSGPEVSRAVSQADLGGISAGSGAERM
jgi:hypothetical protein